MRKYSWAAAMPNSWWKSYAVRTARNRPVKVRDRALHLTSFFSIDTCPHLVSLLLIDWIEGSSKAFYLCEACTSLRIIDENAKSEKNSK